MTTPPVSGGTKHVKLYAKDSPEPKRRAGWPAGLRPGAHLNDNLSNRRPAGVVVTGVRAYALIGPIDRDPMLLGGDPICPFDDDP
jgi:hypothetical protein